MTIEFTYNKDSNSYCLKFYSKGEQVVRYLGSDRNYAIEKFFDELSQLEKM